MSTIRHHADWMRLVENSGPFISMPVLMRVFPQGLDAHDPDHFRTLRLALEEWEDDKDNTTTHRAWIDFVLRQTLELPVEAVASGQTLPPGLEVFIPEHHETIRADAAIVNPQGTPDAGKPRMLVSIFPPSQDPDKALAGSRWKASPATRMMELLHACNVPLGLITNGEQWMLVYAPRNETTGFASWYASLWLEENITLRAFRSLLSARRFFGVALSDTIDALLNESSRDQQEVTDQLGLQVRRAVEILVQTIDRIDAEKNHALLKDVPENVLYEAAVTVMMRLVFLFSAEERGLLLLGNPMYDQHYAMSTLAAQLRETADQHGEEVLERRSDAWSRLLATFRAVHAGVKHEDMLLPPYGGSLFNPDRFPFLEGRAPETSWRDTPAQPLSVDNRTVLHLLESLQFLRVKVPGGGAAEPRRLSFRALDVTNIGNVYEGLLDHKAVRASAKQPVLGLIGSKDKEREVKLEKLEDMHKKGEKEFLGFLTEETGRAENTLKRALKAELDFHAEQRFRVACGNDDALFERVRHFIALVRNDTFDRPVVISGNSVYVTQGTGRRETGTHYTPRILTEPVVQYTLEPLIYVGPAEGLPRDQWKLRTPAEILALKICDIATGSAAFLVAADRYLANRLLEAWEESEHSSLLSGEGFGVGSDKPNMITPFGAPTTNPNEAIPPGDDDRLILARRLIAERCLYGVDKNPLAVEMAKLSLWLITLAKDRPFTFLDHAIKCGDSLLGLWRIEQVEQFHIAPEHKRSAQLVLWEDMVRGLFKAAIEKRKALESFSVLDIADSRRKEELLQDANGAMIVVKTICDLLISAAIATADGNSAKRNGAPPPDFEKHRETIFQNLLKNYASDQIPSAMDALNDLVPEATAMLNKGNPFGQDSRRPFHWPVEFPEVFVADNPDERGFSAIVGNPPFLWGMRLSTNFGSDYLYYLEQLAAVRLGTADLCVHFLRRATRLIRKTSSLGLITVDTIAQGDTREAGLDLLLHEGLLIFRAESSKHWPGAANVKIAQLNLFKGSWKGGCSLDGEDVTTISSRLLPSEDKGKLFALAENSQRSYVGHYLMGQGFVLSVDEAKSLIAQEPQSKEVVFSYLRGEDINQNPSQHTDGLVINFGVRKLEECEELFPKALERIRQLVKPERDKQKRKANRERWWQYAEVRPGLTNILAQRTQVLAQPFTTKYVAPCFVDAKQVFASPLVVIDSDSQAVFAVLQSSLHDAWVRKYASKMGDRVRYSTSDCFETFPFPQGLLHDDSSCSELDSVGTQYYDFRKGIIQTKWLSLTDVNNELHNPASSLPDIDRLRNIHVQLDNTVSAAYGWSDLDLGHGFHKTKQGIRFTINESARREVLDRLLELNHQRYEEEVRQGLHEKRSKAKGKTTKPNPSSNEPTLF